MPPSNRREGRREGKLKEQQAALVKATARCDATAAAMTASQQAVAKAAPRPRWPNRTEAQGRPLLRKRMSKSATADSARRSDEGSGGRGCRRGNREVRRRTGGHALADAVAAEKAAIAAAAVAKTTADKRSEADGRSAESPASSPKESCHCGRLLQSIQLQLDTLKPYQQLRDSRRTSSDPEISWIQAPFGVVIGRANRPFPRSACQLCSPPSLGRGVEVSVRTLMQHLVGLTCSPFAKQSPPPRSTRT
ncbi:MAG: hypothetical protein R3C01_05305 [Planctomycetaceae bacterium]